MHVLIWLLGSLAPAACGRCVCIRHLPPPTPPPPNHTTTTPCLHLHLAQAAGLWAPRLRGHSHVALLLLLLCHHAVQGLKLTYCQLGGSLVELAGMARLRQLTLISLCREVGDKLSGLVRLCGRGLPALERLHVCL